LQFIGRLGEYEGWDKSVGDSQKDGMGGGRGSIDSTDRPGGEMLAGGLHIAVMGHGAVAIISLFH